MNWLKIAMKIQSIAQAGLTYSKDIYDIERFEMLRALSVEIVADHTDYNQVQAREVFASGSGYQTPKVDIRGALFKDDQVLLVKENLDGKWSLPGGWADVGESPKEAVEKEFKEEAGYIVNAKKLVAVHDKSRHDHPMDLNYIYKMLFLCEDLGKRVEIGIETSEVKFFSLDDLPELSTGRILESQVQLLYDHYLNRDLPTEFD